MNCFGLADSSNQTWVNSEDYLCSNHYVSAMLYYQNQPNRNCAGCKQTWTGKNSNTKLSNSVLAVGPGMKLCHGCY